MTFFRELLAGRAVIKAALLLIAMSALASGLGGAITGMSHAMFFPVARFAVLLGWILAFSTLSGRSARILIFISGFLFIILQVGNLWADLGPLIGDPGQMQVTLLKLSALVQKVGFAVQAGSLNDPTVRTLLWNIPVFIVASWAGWTLKRHQNAFYALAPAVAMLAYVLYYSSERPFPLQMTLAVFLLLTGMNEWEKKTGGRFAEQGPGKAVSEANWTIVILSLAIALIAGWIPSISWNSMADRIAQSNREERNRDIADALGLSEDPSSARTFTSPTLPREHLIGGGTPLRMQNIVFTVKTGELPPMSVSEFRESIETIPRYYWRSVSYDIYNGRGWETTLTDTVNYSADEPLFENVPEGYRLVRLQINKTPNMDANLYWTGAPVSVDQPFQVGWRALPGSLPPTADPLSGADALGGVIASEQYRAASLLPAPTIEGLRAAGQDYPEAIRERYLALPTTVPVRVHNLAQELTADSENAYDEAKAIEEFLRTYPYTLDVPPPPEEGDIADHFLFELRTGYCDYYATAMVVLARSAGLPARLVSGYASGSYTPSSAEYVVRLADAHSWAEIYFPGTGWVEFEPTASQPQIERPLEEEETAETPDPVQPAADDEQASPFRSLARTVAIVAGILIMVTALGISLYLAWNRSSSGLSIQQIYKRVFQQGNKLAPSRAIHETPSMFAARLGEHLLRSLQREDVTRQFLAPAHDELTYLTNLYVRALYSPRATSEQEDAQARDTWRRLYWRLLLARVLKGRRPS